MERLSQSAKTRLGADCGSDHELIIAKFRLKLKKVGKTTRALRYDLNQIPYDYTVEVRNRFRSDKVSDELWMEQESSRKTSISASLTMLKPLTVWITINCGKL